MMSHPEIEPWAAKTLLLLRSSNDGSLEEMRAMLMETIHTKYNGRKTYKMVPPLSGPAAEPVVEKVKPKETKVSTVEPKAKTPVIVTTSLPPSISIDSGNSDSENSSSDDSEMVILEDEVPCTVCKESTVNQWNRIVECVECRACYHQQCHNPSISDSEANDPRNVWYCRTCTKTVSKPKPPSSTSSSSSSKDSKSSSSKPSGRTSSPSFGSKAFGGGVSISSKKSVSGKSSNSSSSKVAPNLNMVSADKRLQIMKKKAAKKQEKRPK